MKIAAIISTATIAGSIAFAAGQQSGGKQSPPMPSGAQAHSMQEEMSQARMDASVSAQGCEAEIWFDPTPQEFLGGCGTLATLPLSPADVNADGVPEILTPIGVDAAGEFVSVFAPNNDHTYCGVYAPAVSVQVDVLQWLNLQVTPDGAKPNSRVVCRLPVSFGEFFRTRLPDPGGAGWCTYSWEVRGKLLGWLDCDADGDLDLVIRMTTYKMNSQRIGATCVCIANNAIGYTDVWLRNIAFEPNQLTGDLDGDGRVDGSDLGRLLANWGPAH
jgi:hypothetical protein